MNRSPYEVFPHIVYEDVILRQIVPADADDLFLVYNNKNLFTHTPAMYKKTKAAVANMVGHFERDFAKKKLIMTGIALQSQPETVLGIAEMFGYDARAELINIGYLLREDFWGRGIATKATRAMVKYLFEEIGVNRIEATVLPQNEKSLNVLRRAGFTEEGVLRQGQYWKGQGIVDVVMLSMLQSDYTG